MFGLDITVLAFIGLAAASAAALVYGLMFTTIQNEKTADGLKRSSALKPTVR